MLLVASDDWYVDRFLNQKRVLIFDVRCWIFQRCLYWLRWFLDWGLIAFLARRNCMTDVFLLIYYGNLMLIAWLLRLFSCLKVIYPWFIFLEAKSRCDFHNTCVVFQRLKAVVFGCILLLFFLSIAKVFKIVAFV